MSGTSRRGVLWAKLAKLLSAALILGGLSAPLAHADPSFTILNRSSLTSSQAKFYYLGYGQIGSSFVVLSPTGGWITAGSTGSGWTSNGWNPSANGGKGGYTGAGIVPCYQLTGSPSITIPKNISGARIYFFQVMSGTSLFGKACAGTVATNKTVNGIFANTLTPGVGGQAPFAYFSTANGGAMNGASISQLTSGALPLWTFSEIGSSATTGTIDTSQVDFIGFPMNVTAKMTPSGGTSVPYWNRGVGFSFSPNSQVDMASVTSSYNSFVQNLPVKSGTGNATIYPRANYASLVTQTPGGSVIVNPGNYLSFINQSGFSGFFSNIANNYMWNPGWTGSINTGGAFGPLPQVQFNGTTVQLASYPGYTGTSALYAIKFTASIGAAPNQKTVAAYLLSPSSYQTLCKAGAISGGSCKWMSTAYQIFATDGALNTPVDNNQFSLLTSAQRAVWVSLYPKLKPAAALAAAQANYNAVVGRLGFIVSMAYNHGVAGGLQTTGGLCAGRVLSACWSDQTLWYPAPAAGSNVTKLYFAGDTTQNQLSRWLHTATIGSVPMMTQPTLATKSQSGTMGMGYGFASDENPTPPNSTYSQTPSKYDGNVSMQPSSGCNYITIMPWSGNSPNNSPVNPSCK
jgi:hypothetical protein